MKTVTDDRGQRTTFIRQTRVNLSDNGKTVTGHVVMTHGIWHGVPDGYGHMTPDFRFCIEHRNPPDGLPLTDETTPIGSPFSP
jgi:hypothetical protein